MKRGEIPSIGELTSFVAAAQHGSFTRAAGELNLTQGAISRQIRELEIHLGIRLFERIRQRVVLTDAGKMYLSQVKKAFDDLADATQRVASFSNSTTLNLVALPTFAARWLVPRLPNFQRVNPKIMVHITARQAPIELALEPFDAAVFHGASHWPGTISQYLMDEDIVAVCSPKLNARRAIKAPADLVEFPLLHKMGKPNRWAGWMADVGIASDGLLHGHAYQNFAMVAQAAVAGLGIALLPHYLVEDDIAAKRLDDRRRRVRRHDHLVLSDPAGNPRQRQRGSGLRQMADCRSTHLQCARRPARGEQKTGGTSAERCARYE